MGSTKTHGVRPETLNLGDGTYVASGSLSNGSRVALRSDGKVEVITGTNFEIKSEVQFDADECFNIRSCYDTDTNQIVLIYQDLATSYGYAVVGAIASEIITFGTPVAFAEGVINYPACCYDEGANKVVVAYSDTANSGYGTSKYGTVSGDSISFSAATVFKTSSIKDIDLCHNTAKGRNIIVYTNVGSTDRGEVANSTGISFPYPYVYDSGKTYQASICYDPDTEQVACVWIDNTNANRVKGCAFYLDGSNDSRRGTSVFFSNDKGSTPDCCYDTVNHCVIFVYQNETQYSYGYANIGLITGTALAVGDPIIFASTDIGSPNVAFCAHANRFVIGYRDNASNDYQGNAVVGKVTGTTMSLRDAEIFEAYKTYSISALCVPNTGVVFSYVDNTDVNKGKSVLFIPENTNAELCFGVSNGAYADGASALIYKLGSVADNLSGLNPGGIYYVNYDGSLTESETPFGVLGRALSATKMLITQKEVLEPTFRALITETSLKVSRNVTERVKTANHTAISGDEWVILTFNSGSAIELTIPLNATAQFPIGTVLNLYNTGAGTLTITPISGVIIRNNATVAQYISAKLRKRATDEWVKY